MSLVIKIDPELCIGCNSCVCVDEKTFRMNQKNYKAEVIKQPPKISQITRSAIDSCPVQAISLIDK